MPNLQDLKIVLKERGTGHAVAGGAFCFVGDPGEWPLPCEVPLSPGEHRIEIRHPSRTICGENPRKINVVISTDPNAPPQLEVIEVEPV